MVRNQLIGVFVRFLDHSKRRGFYDRGRSLSAPAIRSKLEHIGRKKKVPEDLREAASCDGLSYSSMLEFPCSQMCWVCRDSLDGTFLVGDLVWRSTTKPGYPDGLIFVQEVGCLGAGCCDKALQGAMFEVLYANIPEQNH